MLGSVGGATALIVYPRNHGVFRQNTIYLDICRTDSGAPGIFQLRNQNYCSTAFSSYPVSRRRYLPWAIGPGGAEVPRIDEARRVGLHVQRTLRAHRGHGHVAVVQAQP